MEKIAVFFPGIGYTTDKPLIYYGREVAYEAGYEKRINVSYSYVSKDSIRGNQEKIRQVYENLYQQAKEQLQEVDWKQYDEILFVSKSIGTVVAACLEKEFHIRNCKQVLYTPLESTFSFAPKDAIAFIGTADPWSNVDQVIELARQSNIPITVYEKLNHSLEGEDTFHNLDILKDVIMKTRAYIL